MAQPAYGNPIAQNVLDVVFDGLTDWREEVKGESPSQYQFGKNESSVSMAISFPWTQLRDAPGKILGYSVYDSDKRVLRRKLPASHPMFYWMHATRIVNGHGQKPLGHTLEHFGPLASYQRFCCNVLFQSLPYILKYDIQVLREDQRYCTFEFKPGVEVIQRRGGNFKFVEGPTPPNGSAFPQATLIRSPKSTLKIRWHEVPHTMIWGTRFNLVGKFNTNWQGCIGKVNNAYWPAPPPDDCYNPSEMLLTAIGVTPHEAPVDPQLVGTQALGTPKTYDVDYFFSVLQPPRDPTVPRDPAIFPQAFGHNLCPAPGTQYYYLATMPNPAGIATLASPTIYQAADFEQLFQGPP